MTGLDKGTTAAVQNLCQCVEVVGSVQVMDIFDLLGNSIGMRAVPIDSIGVKFVFQSFIHRAHEEFPN